MIAWLDALIPPLDSTLGFWLLLAIAIECVAVWIYLRARQHVDRPPDPDADVHGDVTRMPERR